MLTEGLLWLSQLGQTGQSCACGCLLLSLQQDHMRLGQFMWHDIWPAHRNQSCTARHPTPQPPSLPWQTAVISILAATPHATALLCVEEGV